MRIDSRRSFLKLIGIGGGAFLLAGSWPLSRMLWAGEQGYRGVSYLTPSYRAIRSGIMDFLDVLEKNAGKDHSIEFYDAGTLLKADEQLSALQRGDIDFMFHASTYISGAFPIIGITALPIVCDQLYQHGERIVMESPLWRLINDQLAKSNLFLLSTGGGVFEPQYLWSSRSEISSLDDLKGARWRIVGHEATEILKSFGATGIRIPSSKTYLALQRGQLDGVVANISTVVARNLMEHLKVCYKLPVTSFFMGIFFLKDRWDALQADHKEAFWNAGQWYDTHQVNRVNTRIYPNEYWPQVRRTGVRIVQPGERDIALFKAHSRPILSWWRGQVGPAEGERALRLAMGEA